MRMPVLQSLRILKITKSKRSQRNRGRSRLQRDADTKTRLLASKRKTFCAVKRLEREQSRRPMFARHWQKSTRPALHLWAVCKRQYCAIPKARRENSERYVISANSHAHNYTHIIQGILETVQQMIGELNDMRAFVLMITRAVFLRVIQEQVLQHDPSKEPKQQSVEKGTKVNRKRKLRTIKTVTVVSKKKNPLTKVKGKKIKKKRVLVVESNGYQRIMQLLYGTTNKASSWYYALYSKISIQPHLKPKKSETVPTQDEDTEPADEDTEYVDEDTEETENTSAASTDLTVATRGKLLSIAEETLGKMGKQWPVFRHYPGRLLDTMAKQDVKDSFNIFDQFEFLKSKIRAIYGIEEDEEISDETRLEMLDIGMKRAEENDLVPGEIERQNALKWLKKAISVLNGDDCTPNNRPAVFYFLNLLQPTQYKFTPLTGFKKKYFQMNYLAIHEHLIKACEPYQKLMAKFKIPQKLPTDQSNLQYIQTLWITPSKQRFFTRVLKETYVLYGGFKTNGKSIKFSYIDKTKNKAKADGKEKEKGKTDDRKYY